MPKLVGTEDWNTESVREKVGYLMDSITDADDLARTFTAVAGRPDSQDDERAWNTEVRDLRLERLTEATALLFVSDQVEFAQRLLADPGWVLNGRPSEDGQTSSLPQRRIYVSLFVCPYSRRWPIRAKCEGRAEC